MRILYHHRTRAEDAQGIHIRQLCRAFEQLDHRVKVVGLLARRARGGVKDRDHAKEGNTAFNFSVPHWVYEMITLAYNVPAFFVLLWTGLWFKPDFVYERYSLFAAGGYLAARVLGVPFVLEINAPLSQEMAQHGDLTMRRLARSMENWLCGRATRTIVVTEAMKDIFRAQGADTSNFVVMPNGVNRAHFHPGLDGQSVRGAYRLDGCFVVGFVGWIRAWHGVDTLINAAAQLSGGIPDLRLLVVGDGPAVPDLKRLVTQLSADEQVVFTGPVEDHEIPEYIAAMDVAVQPNVTSYASPIKLFEYLATGRAVIGPDKDNIKEVVEDGVSALIYPTGDVSGLAAAIERLYRDDELRCRLADGAAKLVEERGYYWESNAEKVVEMVKTIRQERHRGSRLGGLS